MQLAFIGLLAFWVGVTRAHFRLLYPAPRGVFVSDTEPDFCGKWLYQRAGVLLSTVRNPTSFDNFTSNGEQQLVRYWAREANGGTFCIPLPLNSTGITGVEDGANVTIQCADLTLSSSYEIPSNVTCSNTTTTTATSSSASQTTTSSTTSQAADSDSALGMSVSPIYPAVAVFAAAILSFL
ncbi:uncharacterized protein EV420DRAFT_1475491 [Desarmillaria tabescens]|uniref:Uncharacterized protein n=1 Tax=Armillaria tabescens TaxID=1929756 RepID=A0AA39NGR2_ARMTA|nr:uncharacterized protein EV420DRAFT_1475491 [Desarmillaria tabescens]KAK0465337.1 hypothetical protein EV420DRAFT_1475491 [Desarmillaria tabescens]